MVVGTGSAAFGFSAGIDFGSIHAALGSSAGIDVGSGRAAFGFSIGTDVGSGKLLVPRCDWRSGVGSSVGGGCFAGRAWSPSLSSWGGARREGVLALAPELALAPALAVSTSAVGALAGRPLSERRELAWTAGSVSRAAQALRPGAEPEALPSVA